MVFKAEIYYTMDENHPDIDKTDPLATMRIRSYDDIYTIDDDYGEDYAFAYIRSDLRLIAGGGYSVKHIHNVRIYIEKVK